MIIFTNHAVMKLEQRDISRESVIETLRNPDYSIESYGGRKISYKKFGKLHLAVIWKSENNDTLVITGHWVAKIRRL